MCGIFGFTKYTKEAEIMAPFLAMAMEDRGKDSHGIAFLDNNFNIEVKKDIGPISQAFYTTNLFEGPAKARKAVVAHTRAASEGSITQKNAHPFLFNYKNIRLAGTHNGVLTNYTELSSKPPKYKVDSQYIWHYLLTQERLQGIQGWGSCAALITTPHPYMIFFRFNHNSIYFVDLPNGSVAYASTTAALQKAFMFATGKETSPYTIDANTLYAVDLIGTNQDLVPVATLKFGARGIWKKYAAPAVYVNPQYPYHAQDSDYTLDQPVPPYNQLPSQCVRCHRPTLRHNDVLCQKCIGALNEALVDVLMNESEEEHYVYTAGN